MAKTFFALYANEPIRLKFLGAPPDKLYFLEPPASRDAPFTTWEDERKVGDEMYLDSGVWGWVSAEAIDVPPNITVDKPYSLVPNPGKDPWPTPPPPPPPKFAAWTDRWEEHCNEPDSQFMAAVGMIETIHIEVDDPWRLPAPIDAERARGVLSYCQRVAGDVASLARAIGANRQIWLRDTEATAGKVLASLESAAERLGPGDLCVVSFVGHGSLRLNEVGSHEGWRLKDRSLMEEQLSYLMTRFRRGTRVVLMSDCCYSSEIKFQSPRSAPNPLACELIVLGSASADFVVAQNTKSLSGTVKSLLPEVRDTAGLRDALLAVDKRFSLWTSRTELEQLPAFG